MLEILQGKRGKLIYHENFLYKINKKTTQKIYLECNRRCGTRMIVDSNITNILSLPTPHSHPEESLDDLTMEKIREKMKKRLKKDPTQNLKNVFDNVLEENPRQLAPDYRSVRSSLYRIRAKKVPSVPHEVFFHV